MFLQRDRTIDAACGGVSAVDLDRAMQGDGGVFLWSGGTARWSQHRDNPLCHDLDCVTDIFGVDLASYRNSSISSFSCLLELDTAD